MEHALARESDLDRPQCLHPLQDHRVLMIKEAQREIEKKKKNQNSHKCVREGRSEDLRFRLGKSYTSSLTAQGGCISLFQVQLENLQSTAEQEN